MIKSLFLLAALILCGADVAYAINAGVPTVPTNAALKAATRVNAPPNNSYMYRAGYTSAGDGGDALYVWSSSSTCTDDGGSCIVPKSAPATGRWLLSGTAASSIKVFGAACDALTDDTIPIRNALAARTAAFIPANTTCRIYMSSNSDGIPLHTGYRFYGENTSTSQLQVVVNNTPTFPQFDFAANGKFKSVVVSQIPPPQPYGESGEYSWDAVNLSTGGNGSLTGNATYFIKLTAVDAAGQSTPSTVWRLTLGPGTTNTIHIDLPVSAIGDGTGFHVYASATLGGTYFRQNSSVLAGNTTFTFGSAAFPFLSSGTPAPGSNTTSVTVGDVTTGWSHQLQHGVNVTISGSATAALNNTYTIQRVTFPDHFIIRTTGVAAGTYTDPTHLIGPSGLGTTVFYAWNRDDPVNGGAGQELKSIELDHFTLYDASTAVPLVLFDASGTYDSRFHDLFIIGPVPSSGIVAFRCADASPFSNTINGACFFYHMHDIVVNAQTGLHLSINNNPAPVGPGANAGAGMVDNWQGGAEVILDITSAGATSENGGGKFLQGYFASTNDFNSYSAYPFTPNGSHFELFGCEGCYQHGDPTTMVLGGGANLSHSNNVANLFTTLPPMALSGPLPTVSTLTPCNNSGQPAFYIVTDAPTANPAVGSAVTTGGGAFTIPVYCDGIGPNWKYY